MTDGVLLWSVIVRSKCQMGYSNATSKSDMKYNVIYVEVIGIMNILLGNCITICFIINYTQTLVLEQGEANTFQQTKILESMTNNYIYVCFSLMSSKEG